jgi:replication-associated recombination protein RarA
LGASFISLSAVDSGLVKVREILEKASERKKMGQVCLFVFVLFVCIYLFIHVRLLVSLFVCLSVCLFVHVRFKFKQKTVLFVDEIHRYNKLQQDTFLPYVEDGLK